jgi:RNA polymerase sigma factor (sigma-70 family)
MTNDLRRELEVDDLANAAWVSIQRNLGRFTIRGEGSLLQWLRRAAFSKVLDAIKYFGRKSRRLPKTERLADLLRRDDSDLPRALQAADDPARDFWVRTDVEQVSAALAKLPPGLADVLWHVDFEQCSFPEAGRRLRMSESAVRRRYAIAKVRLAEALRGGA